MPIQDYITTSNGLYYYRNRWYDPEVGRFISEDPIGFAGGDINLYSYVGNNPHGFIDPFGYSPCDPQKGKSQKQGGRSRRKRQSKDELAKDWLKFWNPLSIGEGVELGARICMKLKTGKILVTDTKVGDMRSVSPTECPEGTVSVARLHTHGGINFRFKSEEFSLPDRINANDETVEVGHTVYSYLGTPEGKFLKFIPASIKGSMRGKVVKLKP